MFNANCLSGRFQFNTIEVKMKGSDFLEACLRLDVNSIAMKLNVTSDLKVILLLTHESIVRVGEVEAFIGIDSKVRDWSEEERIWREL